MQPLPLTVSTPGRICLFGEHQDYLGLPVIAAAISRRVQISAVSVPDKQVRLGLPDIGAEEAFALTDTPLVYQHDRDYFRSAINVLRREGFTFSQGIQGEIHGNIPINAGTSSSSALLISWLNVLTQLADQPQQLAPTRLAELAYVAEVLEFGEPGGMMDHYSTAVGNLIYLSSQPAIQLQSLRPALGSFVLGDSSEPKDTIGILGRVKGGMLRIMDRLRTEIPDFSLHTTTTDEVAPFKNLFTADEFTLLSGNIENRDILREALTIIQAPVLDHKAFGQLLYRHQTNLREAQRISTPKIDRMLDAALEAGAYGGKINGSGGGGCMFAYAPEQPEKVAEAIERAGGKAYVIHVDEGTRQEFAPALVTN